MQYPRRVKVLQTSENLVQKNLYVVRRQRLRRDDNLVQVTLHQLGNDVTVKVQRVIIRRIVA